ncbi:MAG: response regulator transcription factor [Gemmatimonadota bacterium]
MLADSTWRRELIFCRFRYAVAALAFVVAAGHRPFPLAALALLLIPVVLHIGVSAGMRRADTPQSARRLGYRVLAADAVIALVTYLIFLRDPAAVPAAFVPLLVFQLAVRFEGAGGVAAGLAVFAAAVGVRVYYQLEVIPGGSLRWPLLLVWVLLAAIVTVLARELRAEARMRLAALRDRERIADSFQLVIGEMLTRSGVLPHAATWEDVLGAVRALCDQEPAECATLAAGIADLLMPAGQAFGLTRREQEIVRLLGLGYPYERIARSLFVSGSTVRNHVHNIRGKLGLSSREEVAAFAREQGLAPSAAGSPPAGRRSRDRTGSSRPAPDRGHAV